MLMLKRITAAISDSGIKPLAIVSNPIILVKHKKRKMEQNSTSNLQQTLTDNLRQLSTLSLSLAKPLMDNVTENFSSVSKSLLDTGAGNIRIPQFKLQGDDCCVPKNECP